ncbi:MAG: DUF4911 domain-containing protein [Candidatus Binatia bacterium]|nr:DUF4911 domain-containing protein [Candidatus Binatia bacterium]
MAVRPMEDCTVKAGSETGGQDRGAVVPIFIEVRPPQIAYWKFLFESYEELAIVRTLDRERAIIVVLGLRDFLPHVHAIVAEACVRTGARQVPPPADLSGDWLLPEL